MSKRLSVLAGDGKLVHEALAVASLEGWDVQVLSLTSRNDLERWSPVFCSISKPVGIVLKLRAFKTSHIWMVGGLTVSDKQREGLFTFLQKKSRGKKTSGDTGLSRLVRALEFTTGAKVIGVHELVPDLIAVPGLNAGPEVNSSDMKFCQSALETARRIGALDIGQAVVASGARILSVEDIAGTDALLARVTQYRAEGKAGDGSAPLILAKVKKPSQPKSVDLPAIGPDTVVAAAKAGISIIAVEAGGTLFIEKAEMLARANELGVSILAFGEV